MKPIFSHETLHHVRSCTSFHVPTISANTSLVHESAADPEPFGCLEPNLTIGRFSQAVRRTVPADAATRGSFEVGKNGYRFEYQFLHRGSLATGSPF